jgi:hypothetical protein
MTIYSIQCSGYDIVTKTFDSYVEGADSCEETFSSATRAHETVGRMLQYMPNSAEYDIRFANDTVLVLSILQRKDEGPWKPCDKNVYIAAGDLQFAKAIKPYLKGKTIVPIEKKCDDLTTETVLPLSFKLAKEIQGGQKEGYITKRHGTERWRLIQVVGTKGYILQNTEGCHQDIPIEDLEVPGVFVVHVVTRIPGIPEKLAGRTPFTYQGLRFIPAGQFKDFGIDTNQKKFWKTFHDHAEYNPAKPILPCWDYDDFYKSVPEQDRENDIFWSVETGIYICPASKPFKFIP